MSKHPWRLHIAKPKEASPGFWSVKTLTGADHYGEDYVAVVSADGAVVADNGQYYPQAISLEDARLIAAAPDLLEALIELCEAGDEAWGESRACVRIARAAIAKATGEQS